MTSINTLLNTTSYGLSSQKTEEVAEETKKSTAVAESASTGLGGAYNLDLSEEAKAYLADLEKKKTEESSKDYGYTLTPAEQKIMNEIVEKYSNLPYTQENFEKLQAELKTARLDPLNLAAKDMVRSFNSTSMLMQALNGTSSDLLSANDRLSAQSGKSDQFINQVAEDWYSQIQSKDDV